MSTDASCSAIRPTARPGVPAPPTAPHDAVERPPRRHRRASPPSTRAAATPSRTSASARARRACGRGRPAPWRGCRRRPCCTTRPSGCASGRRTPTGTSTTGTPSGAPTCRRPVRRRRSPAAPPSAPSTPLAAGATCATPAGANRSPSRARCGGGVDRRDRARVGVVVAVVGEQQLAQRLAQRRPRGAGRRRRRGFAGSSRSRSPSHSTSASGEASSSFSGASRSTVLTNEPDDLQLSWSFLAHVPLTSSVPCDGYRRDSSNCA